MSFIFVYANHFLEGTLDISNEDLGCGFEWGDFHIFM